MNQLTARAKNYSKWYNELVFKAGLAEISGIHGCMIIKPYGFTIWEKMQNILDKMFKDTGHQNAYFPMLIPKSYFSKESSHVKEFSKECAVVTHYRLKNSVDGINIIIDPESKLKEELVIRPTSETIIWETYRRWIKSYRDLPILINQWSNVFRWEMKTRLFLRTSEFLWQEGHTAHSNRKEAIDEARKILNIYTDFVENFMAIPVIKGIKTNNEKFAGAEETYCIEAMMQDGKALQMGTSHFLGQNFSKAFNVKFTTREGYQKYVWSTSWGISTRLIGALIMTHSDDNGLILPPKLAPIQLVIIPIFKNDIELSKITEKVIQIKKIFEDQNIRIKYDTSNIYSPGWKFNEYEMKGVPIRMVIGPKDLKNGTVEIVRRDNFKKESILKEEALILIPKLLKKIQKTLLEKATQYRNDLITKVDKYDMFKKILKKKGGFLLAHWDGRTETEKRIKIETKATIRCIPLEGIEEYGKCIYSNNISNRRVLFSKSY